MNDLININDNNGEPVVSARELHSFLESKQEFSNWIKNRIKKYGFIENEDFTSFDNIIKREKGATIQKEYALKLDCAKEIAMVEGNQKGKDARLYFINFEKKNKVKPLSTLDYLSQQLQLMKEHEEKLQKIEAEQNNQKQKIDYLLSSKIEAERELKALPFELPEAEVIPELSIRDKINILVRKYATATQVQTSDIWTKIYSTLYYNYSINIRGYKKIKKSESYLEVAERKGFIDTIFIIASKLCQV